MIIAQEHSSITLGSLATKKADFLKRILSTLIQEQGRIHGYPSRVRVGRSSSGEGHWGIWAGAVRSKTEKVKRGLTDQPTDRPTDRPSGV